jgi:hypothetical protein
MEKVDCFLWTTSEGQRIVGENLNDRTGNCVAISKGGQVIAFSENLVSEETRENCGRVRVFKKTSNNSRWKEIFRSSGEGNFSLLGHTIALSGDGNTLVIGDPFYKSERGRVLIFRNILNEEQGQSSYEFSGSTDKSKAGWHVSISYDGKTIAYCNSFYSLETFNNQGGTCVKAFAECGTEGSPSPVNTWHDVYTDEKNDYSSQAVSISNSGETLAILEKGVPLNGDDLSNLHPENEKLLSECRVRIMSKNDFYWTLKGTIDCLPVSNLSNHVLSLSGNGENVIIGERSYGGGEGYENVGRVRVYDITNELNFQLKGSEIIGDNIGDCTGNAVGITDDGNCIIFGEQKFSYFNDNDDDDDRVDAGRVRVMRFSAEANEWVQNGNAIEGEIEGDDSGTAVAISGNGEVVIVGEPLHGKFTKQEGKKSYGRVRVFDKGASKFLDTNFIQVSVNGANVAAHVVVPPPLAGAADDDEQRTAAVMPSSVAPPAAVGRDVAAPSVAPSSPLPQPNDTLEFTVDNEDLLIETRSVITIANTDTLGETRIVMDNSAAKGIHSINQRGGGISATTVLPTIESVTQSPANEKGKTIVRISGTNLVSARQKLNAGRSRGRRPPPNVAATAAVAAPVAASVPPATLAAPVAAAAPTTWWWWTPPQSVYLPTNWRLFAKKFFLILFWLFVVSAILYSCSIFIFGRK